MLERVRGKPVERSPPTRRRFASARCCSSRIALHAMAATARGNQALGAPDLTDRDWLYGGDGKSILTSITEGRQGAMPPFGGAKSDQEIRDLAHYVLSLSGRAHDSMRAHFGKPAFSACAACHGADGKGNTSARRAEPHRRRLAPWRRYRGHRRNHPARPQRRDARLPRPAGRGECLARRRLGVRPIAPDAMSATCWHCGESLPPDPPQASVGGIRYAVCCNGCRAVAEWIAELGSRRLLSIAHRFSRPGAGPRRVDAECGRLPAARAVAPLRTHARRRDKRGDRADRRHALRRLLLADRADARAASRCRRRRRQRRRAARAHRVRRQRRSRSPGSSTRSDASATGRCRSTATRSTIRAGAKRALR